MFNRRKFLISSLFGSLGLAAGKRGTAAAGRHAGSPLVISTWNIGLDANRAAWQILSTNGRALDAVETGVNVTEASLNCCVGLDANPDREGIVTLDACIMDERGNCGSVTTRSHEGRKDKRDTGRFPGVEQNGRDRSFCSSKGIQLCIEE